MAPASKTLSKLKPKDVASWLIENGWQQKGQMGNKAGLWEKLDPTGAIVEVMQPLSTDLRDYHPRLLELLNAVAAVEKLTFSELVDTILPTRLKAVQTRLEATYGNKEKLSQIIFGAEP